MEVSFSESFKKALRKQVRNPYVEKEFWYKLELFIESPFNPKLKTHKLSGKLKGLWSFMLIMILESFFISLKINPKKPF